MIATQRPPSHDPDLVLLSVVGVLVIGGLVMLYSASFFVAYNNSADPSYYFTRQLVWAVLGAAALVFFAYVDYHEWRRWSLPILGAVVVLLALVLLIGRGPEGSTDRRWLDVGPFSLQPSEFAKLALVLYMAAWLPQRGARVGTLTSGTIPFAVIVAITGGMVVRQPDFGTTIVLVTMSVAVFFIAGADLIQLTLVGAIGGGAMAMLLRGSPEKVGRFTAWWDPFLTDCSGVTYQMCQALMGLGSGGIGGMGLGASRQKYLWLPAAQNDAIFAIVGEELGLVGGVALVGLYALLAYRGFRIAMAAPDRTGMLLAAGVSCWITFQAIVNLGGMTASMPLTGLPLPFVSAGGSALLSCMAGMGLLLNVSRQTLRAPHAARVAAAT
jgi:cell division protein FtsW